jgi:hypothetical protein
MSMSLKRVMSSAILVILLVTSLVSTAQMCKAETYAPCCITEYNAAPSVMLDGAPCQCTFDKPVALNTRAVQSVSLKRVIPASRDLSISSTLLVASVPVVQLKLKTFSSTSQLSGSSRLYIVHRTLLL